MAVILPDNAEIRTGTGVSSLLNGAAHYAVLVFQRNSVNANHTGQNPVFFSSDGAKWFRMRSVAGGARSIGFRVNAAAEQNIAAGVGWDQWLAATIWGSTDGASGDLVYGINGAELYALGSAAPALETATEELRSIGRQMGDGSSSQIAHAVIWASDTLSAIPTRAELNAVAAGTASLPDLIAAKPPVFYAPLNDPDDGQGGLADASGNGNHFAEHTAGWSVDTTDPLGEEEPPGEDPLAGVEFVQPELMQIGMFFPADWSGEQLMANALSMGRGWNWVDAGDSDDPLGGTLVYDLTADGYPGASSVGKACSISTLLGILSEYSVKHPVGSYTLRFKAAPGTSVQFTNGSSESFNTAHLTPDGEGFYSYAVTITGTGGIGFRVTNADAGDLFRDAALYYPGHGPADTFYRTTIEKLRRVCNVVRTMDWHGGNGGGNFFNWAHRTLPTHCHAHNHVRGWFLKSAAITNITQVDTDNAAFEHHRFTNSSTDPVYELTFSAPHGFCDGLRLETILDTSLPTNEGAYSHSTIAVDCSVTDSPTTKCRVQVKAASAPGSLSDVAGTAYWWPQTGPAYEHDLALAAALNADLWLVLPHYLGDPAHEDSLTDLLEFVRDNLPAHLRIYLEFSNEIWNGIFGGGSGFIHQANFVRGISRREALSGWAEATAWCEAHIFGVAATVFAGQTHRCLRVLAEQSVASGAGRAATRAAYLATQFADGGFDVLASAPYIEAGTTTPTTAADVVAAMADYWDDTAKARVEIWSDLAATLRASTGRAIAYVPYEGGQHLTWLNTSDNSWARYAAQTHADMGTLLERYTDELWAIPHIKGRTQYVFISPRQDPNGGKFAWGALDHTDESEAAAPKWQALMHKCRPKLASHRLGLEEIGIGAVSTVRWSGGGDSAALTLQYSDDDGENWTTIADDIDPDDGSYAWDTTGLTAGDYLLRLHTTGDAERGDVSLRSFIVGDAAAPTITTTTLPQAKRGQAYSKQLEGTLVAADGWSLITGTLPTGITLSDSGLISGNSADTADDYVVTVQADGPGGSDTQELTLTLGAADPLAITTESLDAAVANVESTQQLASSGGAGAKTWSEWPYLDCPPGPAGFSGGPGDWNAQSNGGVAVTAGVTTSEVLGINTTSAADHADVAAILQTAIAAVISGVTVAWTGTHIRISAAPGSDPILAIGTPADPEDYDADFSGDNYLDAASAVVGKAPDGVTIPAGGLMSRDVADDGVYPLRVRIVDADSSVDTADFTLTVGEPPAAPEITTDWVRPVFIDRVHEVQFEATGTVNAGGWSIVAGTPPLGVGLTDDGLLLCMPITGEQGVYPLTIQAEGPGGTDTVEIELVVFPAPRFGPDWTPQTPADELIDWKLIAGSATWTEENRGINPDRLSPTIDWHDYCASERMTVPQAWGVRRHMPRCPFGRDNLGDLDLDAYVTIKEAGGYEWIYDTYVAAWTQWAIDNPDSELICYLGTPTGGATLPGLEATPELWRRRVWESVRLPLLAGQSLCFDMIGSHDVNSLMWAFVAELRAEGVRVYGEGRISVTYPSDHATDPLGSGLHWAALPFVLLYQDGNDQYGPSLDGDWNGVNGRVYAGVDRYVEGAGELIALNGTSLPYPDPPNETHLQQALEVLRRPGHTYAGVHRTELGLEVTAEDLAAMVAAGPIVVTTPANLGQHELGAAFGVTFAATGGYGAVTWEVTDGALPTGITLVDGQPTGALAALEAFDFTLSFADESGLTAERQFTGEVVTEVSGGDVTIDEAQRWAASRAVAGFRTR